MSTPLVLVGAGGLAREVLEVIAAIEQAQPGTWSVRGCLDDAPELAGSTVAGVPVLGPTGLIDEHGDAAVALCVARPAAPRARLALATRLALEPGRYATLVHPHASLGVSTEVGAGSILFAGVVTTATVSIGRQVVVMPNVVLTHDDVIADGVTFGAGVRLAGGVTVAEGAYLGAGALVREHVSIGAGAVVGMGAVVLADVPPDDVWAGVPAGPVSPAAVGR